MNTNLVGNIPQESFEKGTDITLIDFLITSINNNMLVIEDLNTTLKQLHELSIACNFEKDYTRMLFDFIVYKDFDVYLYENKLNYDGFYLFLNEFPGIYDYEFLKCGDTFIVKKSVCEPYFMLDDNEGYEKANPIVYRNFEKPIVKPFKLPYEVLNCREFVRDLCRDYNVESLLELGVSDNLAEVIKDIVPTVFGVDQFNSIHYDGILFRTTTNKFFENNSNIFDMVFINSCFKIDYLVRDFERALTCLGKDGIVVIKNTYPVTKDMTRHEVCSNTYLIVSWIREYYRFLQVLNIPISPGICIVKKDTNFYKNSPQLQDSKYSIIIGVKNPDLAEPVLDSLGKLKAKILIGAGYPSFAKLVNDAILMADEEIVIFCGHKVRPKPEEVRRIIDLLNIGYGLVGLYRFGFFGFKKELIRRIGWFDERYIGGGFEDDDMIIRMMEANIAYYEEDTAEYHSSVSSWNYDVSALHYYKKWNVDSLIKVVYRMLPEESYSYDIGPNIGLEFLPSKHNMLISWGVAAKYVDYRIQ